MEKIDWSKERTLSRNFCGYCSNTISTSCDGGCFTRDDIDPNIIKENRMIHIIDLLRCITKDRKHLDKREMYLRKQLLKVKNSKSLS